MESNDGTFFYRVIGAAVLDGGVYEDTEADRRMTIQAALVVVLSSVAAGIGAGGPFGVDAHIFLTVTGIGLLMWTAWALLIFHVGTRWLREP